MNTIENQLKTIVATEWNESIFGQSKMKADYKRQLSNILLVDDFNRVHHNNKSEIIPESEVMFLTESNGKYYKFVSGVPKIKEAGKGGAKEDILTISLAKSFPPFAKLIIDYLLGRLVIFENKLYDVNAKQLKVLDEFTVSNLYGFKNGQFIFEILSGIHKIMPITPSKTLELYKIAGNDFIIDLENHTLTRKTPDPVSSYFKYYDVDFNQVKKSQQVAEKFLEYVIANEDSLHNAKLQAYYIAQVACGLRPKTNFFISKSGVRTGKGLRHIALSGLFNKIDVELDNLTSKGFEAMNAWAMFSGGEMALATEQGDIQGEKIERALKIIATEKTHVARSIGGNQGLVLLTAVLCVDTNKTVALSDEMNGRRVLIQYQERPINETDIEREAIFSEYWETFTNKDKTPKIEGSLGFLLSSLEYYQRIGRKFEWCDVEVFNDEDLDDFQLYLLNALSESDFVELTPFLRSLRDKLYKGDNHKINKSLNFIGVKSYRKSCKGGKLSGYKIHNQKRFNNLYKTDEDEETLSGFEI